MEGEEHNTKKGREKLKRHNRGSIFDKGNLKEDRGKSRRGIRGGRKRRRGQAGGKQISYQLLTSF